MALQLPEGLKVHAKEIMRSLQERTGSTLLLIGDPCYGACDFLTNFRDFADALVQMGHTEIPSLEAGDDIFFCEVYSLYDPMPVIEEALPRLGERVGLITTVQHIKALPRIVEFLESNGRTVLIGEGDARVKYPGQVLGCNVTSATALKGRVDSVLYIGTGDFHPIAVRTETGLEVIVADPERREVRDVEEAMDRIMRRRHAAIAISSEAKDFAIIVSSKPGQRRLGLAHELMELIISHGRAAYLVILAEVAPETLRGIGVDVMVSTACPRLAYDEYLRFHRPIITPQELRIALGVSKWEDYHFDSMLG